MSRVVEMYMCCTYMLVFCGCIMASAEKKQTALTRQNEGHNSLSIMSLLSFNSFPKGVTPWLVA